MALLLASLAISPAMASDLKAPTSGREIWAGADISENVWLLYSGVTLAPWSGIHDPGWRFRAAGGYGGYIYDKDAAAGPDTDVLTYDADTYFTDLLAGYLLRFGELTAKAFVGASLIAHEITPYDEQTVAIGDEIGVKGVVELWLNIGERGWGSLDLSWSSAHDTRTARTRLGYKVWPKVSLGIEGGLNVDAQASCRMEVSADAERCLHGEQVKTDLLDYARAGGFARYDWGTGEVSVSAGVLGDSFSAGDEIELAPYVTVNWLTQF